jgi:hypothetical protein
VFLFFLLNVAFSFFSGIISYISGLDKHCTCYTFIPRSPLCSREHMLQSSCVDCPLDGLHYKR